MSERRAPRLVVEVTFLAALAVALRFAGLRAYEVVGVMVLGWLIAAVFEWGALRGQAHYGSGSPARWYVPQLSLPPPRPLEQVSAGYPAELGDEPTWIASPAMLADWPVAEEPLVEHRVGEETQLHDVLEVELAVAVVEKRPEETPELETPEELEPPEAQERSARHNIDPLEEPQAKARRFGRRVTDERVYAEVPDRPQGVRLLPSHTRSEE